MLAMSQQNFINLAGQLCKVPTVESGGYVPWWTHMIFVKDTVSFPTDSSGAFTYINSALNGSAFGNTNIGVGNSSNVNNCLGIASFPNTAGIHNNDTFMFNGTVDVVAKKTGRVGGVILTNLYGPNTSVQIQANYPIPADATNAVYLARSGDNSSTSDVPAHTIWNYLAITDSVGLSGAVILSSLDFVQDSTYSIYGASLKFSGV